MWQVSVRRSLRPAIDALKGKKTGYAAAYEQLRRDPCLIYPTSGEGRGRAFAYRVSGPLAGKVCGVHLKNNYRLAFTMRPAEEEGDDGVVEILYVGPRDTRDRSQDIWTIVHELFGVENPTADHLRPPCCEDDRPEIDEAEVEEFMNNLRHFLRGR